MNHRDLRFAAIVLKDLGVGSWLSHADAYAKINEVWLSERTSDGPGVGPGVLAKKLLDELEKSGFAVSMRGKTKLYSLAPGLPEKLPRGWYLERTYSVNGPGTAVVTPFWADQGPLRMYPDGDVLVCRGLHHVLAPYGHYSSPKDQETLKTARVRERFAKIRWDIFEPPFAVQPLDIRDCRFGTELVIPLATTPEGMTAAARWIADEMNKR